MDTLGAVLGPLLALGYLYFYPADYKTLFFIAFFPGVLAILASFLLKDKNNPHPKEKKSASFFASFRYWKNSPALYRKVVFGLLAFALFNSSDVFLLLKAKESGLNDTHVIGLYIFYNLIYALFAFPIGIMADKIGLKRTYLIGLTLFTIVYLGMGLSTDTYVMIGLFALYGIYAAATEGIAKAWISNCIDKKDTATAIGTYAGFQSICTLLASALAGLIWYRFGANETFIITGIATILILIYFVFWVRLKEN